MKIHYQEWSYKTYCGRELRTPLNIPLSTEEDKEKFKSLPDYVKCKKCKEYLDKYDAFRKATKL